MNPLAFALLPAILVMLGSGILFIFGVSDTLGPRKGKLLRSGGYSLGGACCLAALTAVLFNWWQPISSVEGKISAVSVPSKGGSRPTVILVRAADGSLSTLRAADRSEFFRCGQYVRATYQRGTGFIRHVDFYAQDGELEGTFNGPNLWTPSIVLTGLGVLVISVVYCVYRRDPEGRFIKSKPRNPGFVSS